MMRRADATSPNTAWGVSALVVGIGLAGFLSFTPALDTDVWWHLATGRWILAGKGIPTTDPFTFTAFGRPWITHEWLSGVLFYVLSRAGGVNVLVFLKALLAALAIGASALAALVGARPRSRLAGAAVGALLAAPLMAPRAFVRPHMITALFLGLLLLLLRLESGSGRRVWRVLLVPFFCLWANLHSGFVLGFALLLLYWAGDAIAARSRDFDPKTRPAWRERGYVLLLAFAGSLVNPHHIHAHLYPFHLIARPEVRANIVELRSIFHPAYRGAFFLKALIATGATGAILLLGARRRLVWSLLLPGLFFWILGLASIRGLSEFAALLPALFGAHAGWLSARRRLEPAVCVAVIVLGVGGAAYAALHGTPMGLDGNQRIGLAIEPGSRPASAARFLRETRPAGHLFNLLSYGGYLIDQVGPETKVFIDGRLDIYPPGFLDAYARMMETGKGWKETVDRYDITVAVVNFVPNAESDRGVRAMLRNDPDWACVLAGDYTLVYARRDARNKKILDRYAIGFDPSMRSRDFIGEFTAKASQEDVDGTLAALDAMHRVAPEEIAPSLFAGQILDRIGRGAEAIPCARRALRLDPSSMPLRMFLAGVLERADSLAAARTVLVGILAEDDRNVPALSLLAMVERGEEHGEEAIRLLERAAAIDPWNPEIQVRLGVTMAEAGRLDEGRRHLQKALQLRPNDPSALRNMQVLDAMQAPRRNSEGIPTGRP
jgi:Flp pilus assembly protein TadD